MKLPDARYTTNAEHCGHEAPKHIARFCGEWLRDPELWPERPGNQAPPFDTEWEAVSACVDYERNRWPAPDSDAMLAVHHFGSA